MDFYKVIKSSVNFLKAVVVFQTLMRLAFPKVEHKTEAAICLELRLKAAQMLLHCCCPVALQRTSAAMRAKVGSESFGYTSLSNTAHIHLPPMTRLISVNRKKITSLTLLLLSWAFRCYWCAFWLLRTPLTLWLLSCIFRCSCGGIVLCIS